MEQALFYAVRMELSVSQAEKVLNAKHIQTNDGQLHPDKKRPAIKASLSIISDQHNCYVLCIIREDREDQQEDHGCAVKDFKKPVAGRFDLFFLQPPHGDQSGRHAEGEQKEKPGLWWLAVYMKKDVIIFIHKNAVK